MIKKRAINTSLDVDSTTSLVSGGTVTDWEGDVKNE